MTPTLPAAALLPRALSTAQFQTLAEVPPEVEWFNNLTNTNTRRAYRQDIEDFMAFAGLSHPEQFRHVTRAHVIAWREQLVVQDLANDTIRRKLAALSSLYAYLCDRNALLHNPVLGVKRPRSMNREGVTPALGDHQARMLLAAPPEGTLKGKRDRAVLATLLYHGLRCEELCTLTVGSVHQREGVLHIRVEGKGDKIRYLPLHVLAQRLIAAYLKAAGHEADLKGLLFRPIKNNRTRVLAKPLHPVSVYQDIVNCEVRGASYQKESGINSIAQFIGLCSKSKWSKHRTKSPFLAWLAMAGSNAAYKIISACSNAVS
jgi:integrase/recombinase XerD